MPLFIHFCEDYIGAIEFGSNNPGTRNEKMHL